MEDREATASEWLDLIGLLLLAQLALLVTNVIEALVFTAILGPLAAGGLVLSLVAVLGVGIGRVGIARGRRWARRLIMAIEAILLLAAVLGIVLAVLMTRALPPPVTLLTQLVLPVSIVTLLRGRAVRDRLTTGVA